MSDLYIEKSPDSPEINLSTTGQLYIEGRAIPEDPFSFWQPVLEWVSSYTKQPAAQTTLSVYLDYINSSSSMYVNEILKRLDLIHQTGNIVSVNWRYDEDDDTLLQLGEDLETLVSIPFKFDGQSIAKERMTKVRIRNKKSGLSSIISQKYWDTIKRNGHGEEYEVEEI